MSARQRIVLLAIAAVVLAGGIVLAASSGGDDDSPVSGEDATPPQTVQTTGPGEKPEEEPDGPPPERIESIRIRDGRPVGGEKTFSYDRGDTIALRFQADGPAEVHVHGFDTEYRVGRQPRVVRFKASLEGIFEIEEHASGEVLAKLEIQPK